MQKQPNAFLLRRGSVVLMWMLIAVTLAAPVADSYPHIGAAMALVILGGVGCRRPGFPRTKKSLFALYFQYPVSGFLFACLKDLAISHTFITSWRTFAGWPSRGAILWAIFDLLGASEVTERVIAGGIHHISDNRDRILATLLALERAGPRRL